MQAMPRQLLNTPDMEAWPAELLRARSNAHARAIALAEWVVRDKGSGRYLAAQDAKGRLHALAPPRRDGAQSLARALDAIRHRAGTPPRRGHLLPIHGLHAKLEALGLDADDYGARTGLPLVPEPMALAFAGPDRYCRPLWLDAPAARAWAGMRDAARRDDIFLDAISGYRSHAYQLGIFARKRARGQAVDEILTVNAAPGFSEHHSGRALDIGTPDELPAEESFEATPAFAWLQAHAGDHGFRLSYPRDNPHGIVYEPWHWYHVG